MLTVELPEPNECSARERDYAVKLLSKIERAILLSGLPEDFMATLRSRFTGWSETSVRPLESVFNVGWKNRAIGHALDHRELEVVGNDGLNERIRHMVRYCCRAVLDGVMDESAKAWAASRAVDE
jgi:hypothetical protein